MTEQEMPPVRAARAGDPGAWDALFRRYQLPLYSYAFELMRDRQTALDIVQETFVNAARHIGSLREDGKFSSWLFGIAHQKCVQVWRRKRLPIETDEEIGELPDAANPPDAVLVAKEQEGEFMKFLEQLPAPQRSVLVLHFLEDFSLEEIAAITGSPTGTVKSRLYYAKAALKKILEENAR